MTTRPTPENLTQGLGATRGELVTEHVSITFGGACPVQGYGLIGGEFPCYYRSRGSGWQFEVYEPGVDLEDGLDGDRELFSLAEAAYSWPDGGWLCADESCANIRRGVAAFLERRAQGVRLEGYRKRVSASSERTLESQPEDAPREPEAKDPEVEQRMAELRWRLVGIDLGKLLQDGTRVAMDLHAPGLDASDLRAALVRGICYGLRGDPRSTVEVQAELDALARLAGLPLVQPEPPR